MTLLIPGQRPVNRCSHGSSHLLKVDRAGPVMSKFKQLGSESPSGRSDTCTLSSAICGVGKNQWPLAEDRWGAGEKGSREDQLGGVHRNPGGEFLSVAQWFTNPTRDHEVAGSVPAFAQWVNDLALP